ncbi:MAG: bifunctional diaminohydroxyphosphoribosylaminopyrimidine deaminase/5-amino-6-(5-phosphoribosylamino)uracil reductase RibD [Nitrospinota bacterium]|nr:bifunctional diaminohydroxyphosphoribosylaminopyrimidine deaminase/5-amino-6-(5-phosphoribosylamino)uracil reductase RibD [Nitrospinota bacterium]
MKPNPQEKWMKRALDLAAKAAGRTSPNPMVGAVIIKNGRFIAEGYHKKAGGPHAEIEALKKAGKRARGAQMFLNLEPCCHQGRTPPCTDALIKSGIKEVFVGMRDPNPLVAGKGIRQLKKAGVDVHSGLLQKECERLNEAFVKYIQTGTPFVTLKSASSLDGKIATSTGQSQWITGPEARERVHRMRDQVDAILVGAGTVIKDNPRLTTRLKKGKGHNPARVILDTKAEIPLNARVFHHADRDRVVYVTTNKASAVRINRLTGRGVEIQVLSERKGRISLKYLIEIIGKMEVVSVLLEGGSGINASALREGIVDKVVLFLAPMIIGGESAPGMVGGSGIKNLKEALSVKNLTVSTMGSDLMVEGYL